MRTASPDGVSAEPNGYNARGSQATVAGTPSTRPASARGRDHEPDASGGFG